MSDVTGNKLHNDGGRRQTGGMSSNSSPIQPKKSITQDVNDSYSQLFSQCTQEENENNVDVMWDWYSPQSKPCIRKHKRSDIQQSPKLPIKRQPSNSQMNGFNKLREELETLTNHIVENTATGAVLNPKPAEMKHNINANDLQDVFNDSMDEELLVCSQKVEDTCINKKSVLKDQPTIRLDELFRRDHVQKQPDNKDKCIIKHNNNNINEAFNTCHNNVKHNTESNVTPKFLKDSTNKIADDSFDFILETLKDGDLELDQPIAVTDERIGETSCTDKQNNDQHIENATCPIQAQDSFKCTVEEIERKRKEALSKLQTKRKQVVYEAGSPLKCSPEEIEQKRLQALAKLEAKKKQDIIERNRQQALKRLEENKRKRALQAQSSLPRKIHSGNI